MTRALLKIGWLNLRRDRAALALTFVLPIVFFSIFAVIFGGMGGGGSGGSSALRVAVVDLDDTEVSQRFIDALDEQSALRIIRAPSATEEVPTPPPFDQAQAQQLVRRGTLPAAVIVPEGFGASFAAFGTDGEPVQLIHDPSNPLARHTVAGLIQASAMTAAPDILLERGVSQLEQFGGALTPGQRTAIDALLPVLRGEETWSDLEDETDADDPTSGDAPADTGGFTGLVEVESISARELGAETNGGGDAPRGGIVSYYAAGIGVMFLLFSMAGAAGSLLDEEANGTLERLLNSRVTMGRLLGANWLFFTIVGVAQLVIMFVWGALVFGLDLFTPRHLIGCAVMTLATAAAAAGFGLILATLCRSRGQLSGISTVVILIMSALGGSMVPRFVMPEFMNTTALFTFNGWALDGYLKVFWYDDPAWSLGQSILALGPQVGVLVGLTVLFLVVARLLARRWETN